jgi:hypothetical protein
VSLRWSLASQQIAAVVISTAPSTDFPSRLPLLWRLLLLGVCCFAGWPDILQQPDITGTLLESNPHAVLPSD